MHLRGTCDEGTKDRGQTHVRSQVWRERTSINIGNGDVIKGKTDGSHSCKTPQTQHSQSLNQGLNSPNFLEMLALTLNKTAMIDGIEVT